MPTCLTIGRRAACALAAALTFFALAFTAPSAGAVETVLQDDAALLHRPDDQVRAAMSQIRALGVDRVRLTAGWSVLAPKPDAAGKPAFDATDPAAYPQVNWRNLDRAVQLASDAGLDVMIDIAFWAPRWATQDGAGTTGRLRTEVDPQLYAQFAQAVARRYSGRFTPPLDTSSVPEPTPDGTLLDDALGRHRAPPVPPAPVVVATHPLPQVSMFTLWNEPNHADFLSPQWVQVDGGWQPRSPEIYRAMVQAAYPAIKSVAPESKVLIGATASVGSAQPGQGNVPPLRFLRALACVDARLRPIATGGCAGFRQVPGDGWAHHPYSRSSPPGRHNRYPDNAPVADTQRLTRLLRRLVAMGRLAPADADVYMTEYGYETNPPDPTAGVSLEQQSHYLSWAEYLATRDPGVKMWPQFLLYDMDGSSGSANDQAAGGLADWQSGLFFADGRPKPSAASFHAPLFATCVGRGRRRRVLVWGRVRGLATSTAAIVDAARAGGATWAPSATAASRGARARSAQAFALTPGAGFVRYVPYQRGLQLRMRWLDPTAGWQTGLPVAPVGCP